MSCVNTKKKAASINRLSQLCLTDAAMPNAHDSCKALASCNVFLQRIPERILEKAIKGMLPKGRLGHRLATHLKIFKGTRHPHGAQQPIDITSRINQSFNNAGNTAGAAARLQ